MAVSGDELRSAAELARGSVVVGRAVMLARWVGTGRRPVTAGQVLRKADVPVAGAAVGVAVPARLRTMADIPALHRPWCVAVATGLLQIGGGWVSAGPAMEHWPPGEAVRLPVTATLGDLQNVIRVLFEWDGDHLHVFQTGKKAVQRPALIGLDGTRDEEAIRSCDVMARNSGKISYTYDLGACWEHEITLEQTLPGDRGQGYPVCVAYRGDSPVEYWSEDDPEEPEPFDLAEVNRKLAALGGEEK